MDPHAPRDAGFTLAGEVPAARVLDRQREELRGERDRMMLDLSGSLGLDELAAHLGVSASAMSRLVGEARGRLGGRSGGADAPPQFSVRRLGAGTARWAEADAHYAALGRTGE